MRNKIENSKAYKALEPVAQQMINKRKNRIQIEDAIIQARNIGIEQWKLQTELPNKWKKIVEEIVTEEKEASCHSIS